MPAFDVEPIRAALRERSGKLAAELLLREPALEVGVVEFRVEAQEDPKQIVHPDKAVVALVLGGSGRLRIGAEVTAVRPGILVHLPPDTPHDFAATTEPLVLLYALVST